MPNLKEKRMIAENKICEMLDVLDKTKYNSNKYRRVFAKMTDTNFTKFMKNIQKREEYLSFEIDSLKDKLTLEDIFKASKRLKVPVHQYVTYPSGNPDIPPFVSPQPVLILTIPVRRLQQLLSKKNSASASIDEINLMTGAVTGKSKTAAVNDTQIYSLLATGNPNTIKEFMSVRSDDEEAKFKMLSAIESSGTVRLDELDIQTKNKQAIKSTSVMLRSTGLRVTVT